MASSPPVGWALELGGPQQDVVDRYRASAERLFSQRHTAVASELADQVDLLLLRVDRALVQGPPAPLRLGLLEVAELLFRCSAAVHRRRWRLLDAWITSSAARRLRRHHLG